MKSAVVLSIFLFALNGCSGGAPWREVKAFDDLYSPNDLWVFGPDDVWVVGGTIQRFDGTDWTQQTTDSLAGVTAIWLPGTRVSQRETFHDVQEWFGVVGSGEGHALAGQGPAGLAGCAGSPTC